MWESVYSVEKVAEKIKVHMLYHSFFSDPFNGPSLPPSHTQIWGEFLLTLFLFLSRTSGVREDGMKTCNWSNLHHTWCPLWCFRQMNRTGTGPPTGGRNVQQLCGGGTKEGDESLDLFWRIHQNRTSSHHGSDHQKGEDLRVKDSIQLDASSSIFEQQKIYWKFHVWFAESLFYYWKFKHLAKF